MISHRHRCIYVKLPKCASTAVRDWFLAHGAGRHSFRPYWYPGPLSDRLELVARALELYPDYSAFTFVRNPYRRFVSVYLHASRLARQRGRSIAGHPASYGSACEFAQLCAEFLADTRALWGREARAFQRDNPDRRYGPHGIALRHLRFLDHVRPQVDFVPDCNPERLFGVPRTRARPLSYIGAVETIDADFDRVKEILGLPGGALQRRNVSALACECFEALRTDAASRALIEEIYAEDFAFTGCGFDDAPDLRRTASGSRSPIAKPRRSVAVVVGRGRYALDTLGIALEARMYRSPSFGPLLAPLARLRRRLARSGPDLHGGGARRHDLPEPGP